MNIQKALLTQGDRTKPDCYLRHVQVELAIHGAAIKHTPMGALGSHTSTTTPWR